MMDVCDRKKLNILLVDDSAFNRVLLRDMLEDSYHIDEADCAEKAISILEKRALDYALVLLDIVMPGKDGFSVLSYIRGRNLIDDLPVIMISSETRNDTIKRAYQLGAADFIQRPFDVDIVRQRVHNTISLYEKQRKMADIIAQKLYENEKNSNVMTNILSHIVEARNGESGPHVTNIAMMTQLFMEYLSQKYEACYKSVEEISVISSAAALHDIGKISIPSEILNKKGKLTQEEFEIMKTHSAAGADMLEAMPQYKDEPIVKAAREITRWHHERWDGRGYPDGLKGDQIPISAQVVSVVDVYDALTSERCYKPAFSHEKALEMIQNGECGVFNPLLMECLIELGDQLRQIKEKPEKAAKKQQITDIQKRIQSTDALSTASGLMCYLQEAMDRLRFLTKHVDRRMFWYSYNTTKTPPPIFSVESISPNGLVIGAESNFNFHDIIDVETMFRVGAKAKKASPENPEFQVEITLHEPQGDIQGTLACKAIWVSDPPRLQGVVGYIKD